MMGKYFIVSLKRSYKYFLLCLLLLAVGIFGVYLIKDSFNTKSEKKVVVGIVGNTDDQLLSIGLGVVTSNDASKDYIKIRGYESEDLAKTALDNYEISGYIVIPDDYVNDILRGRETTARFVAHDSGVGLEALLINDALSTISNLVVESQVGIFAMEDYYLDNDIEGYNNALKGINLRYIMFVLNRDDMAHVECIGGTEYNTAGYYISAVIVIAFLMIGILCCNLAVRTSMSLPKLLYFTRLRSFGQVICEIGVFSLIPAAVCLGACFGLTFVLDISFLNSMMYFIKLLPVVFALSFMQFFIYELCDNIISAFVFQFLVTALLSYASGLFYPTSFFPYLLRRIAEVLPIGAVFRYTQSIFSGNIDFIYCSVCIGYAVLFLLLSVLVRKMKIRSERL